MYVKISLYHSKDLGFVRLIISLPNHLQDDQQKLSLDAILNILMNLNLSSTTQFLRYP